MAESDYPTAEDSIISIFLLGGEDYSVERIDDVQFDCNGTADGSESYDECGVCNGDGSACCHDYLGVDNELWDYLLTPEAVNDMIERLEGTQAVLEWIKDEMPRYPKILETFTCQQLGDAAEINRLWLEDCSAEDFEEESEQFLKELSAYTDCNPASSIPSA